MTPLPHVPPPDALDAAGNFDVDLPAYFSRLADGCALHLHREDHRQGKPFMRRSRSAAS